MAGLRERIRRRRDRPRTSAISTLSSSAAARGQNRARRRAASSARPATPARSCPARRRSAPARDIRGPKIAAARLLRNGLQRVLVEVSAHHLLHPEQARASCLIAADADRVDAHAVLRGEVRRLHRVHVAGVAGTVGQQYQHPVCAGSSRSRLMASPMASPIAVCCPARPICASSRSVRTVLRSRVSGACR